MMVEEKIERETLMKMSPWEFDQSPEGWRKIDQLEGRLAAVVVVQEYINQHREEILNPKPGEKIVTLELMYSHIAQMLALEGVNYYAEAIEAFNESFRENRECWNAYVSATIGFLTNNVAQIEEAIATIEASQETDKTGGNITIVRNFKQALERGEQSYMNVYFS